MSKEECRLCGNFSLIKIRLSDIIKDCLSFKEFAEFFCRVELDDSDSNMPTAVCSDCYTVLLNFCMFTVNVEKQQNKFKNRLPQDEIPTESSNKLAITKNEESNFKESSSTTSAEQLKSNKKRKVSDHEVSPEQQRSEKIDKHEQNIGNCLQEVALLFKDELGEREKQYEKVTIKESLLLDGGEIPRNWLERYRDFITWQDFSYQCYHCNKQIKSLNDLLKHYDEYKVAINKRIIKCSCGKIFKDLLFLVSYLNHVGKVHYNHLKFTCIFCSKVFINVVKLSRHIELFHSQKNVKFYPCLDCGLTCLTIDRLKQHKNCHEV